MPTQKQAGRATPPPGTAPAQPQEPGSSSNNVVEDGWSTSPWTLCFRDPHKEAAYQAYFSAHTTQQRDPVAAASYLTMIVVGGIVRQVCLHLGTIPQDGCSPLQYGSLVGPLTHVVLLRVLRGGQYSTYRTAILLAYRAYYLVMTTLTYTTCALTQGAPWEESPWDETPFSALFWRSGMVGLWYYAAAFLLLWHHFLPVQLAFWVAYTTRLTPRVCATTSDSGIVAAALRTVHDTLAVIARWVLAAHGAIGVVEYSSSSSSGAVAAAAAAGVMTPVSGVLSTNTGGASTSSGWSSLAAAAAAGASGIAGNGTSSISGVGVGVCLQGACPGQPPPPPAAAAAAVSLLGPTLDCPYTLWGLQTTGGLLLPCFLVYVLESRARRQWAKSQYLAILEASSRLQGSASASALPRNASSSSSSASGGSAAALACSRFDSQRAANGGRGLSLSRAANEGWGGEAGDVWGWPNAPAAAADVALGHTTPLYCQVYCLAVAAVGVWGALGWLQRQGLPSPWVA